MGETNSSVTRAWPVFGTLLDRDRSGQSWLPRLMRMGANPIYPGAGPNRELAGILPEVSEFGCKVPRNFESILDVDDTARLRNCFEVDLPPTQAFLSWLIANPSELQPPKQRAPVATETERNRKALLSGDSAAAKQAQGKLAADGPLKSRRKWWAFEGFTSVDVLLETDTTIIVIECKRNETLSASVMWYEGRDQLGRNLEVAAAYAATKGKDYGAMVASEISFTASQQTLDRSLPHLSASQRHDLYDHYWGNVAWAEIQAQYRVVNLPENVADAKRAGLNYAVRKVPGSSSAIARGANLTTPSE